MNDDQSWSWPVERAELLALVGQLTPADALAVIERLLQVEAEGHLAPFLAGLIRGSVARREDEQRRTAT